MSNWHILTQSKKGDSCKIIFHISIPSENTFSEISLRKAIKEHFEPQPTLDSFITEEKKNIRNGRVFEVKTTVKYSANLSESQIFDKINQKHATLSVDTVNELRTMFKYWKQETV